MTHKKYGYLAAATLLFLFANGRYNVAIAAWLAPIFLLLYLRHPTLVRGWLMTFVVFTATWAFQFRGMAPLPPVFYVVLAAFYGLYLSLPFLAHQLFSAKVPGLKSTLILPCTWVCLEYVLATFSPYGSWGSLAYTQYENLELLQLISVTGLYGIPFLIYWSASTVSWAIQNSDKTQQFRKAIVILVVVLSAVLIGGGLRLQFTAPSSETMRVAAITKSDTEMFADFDMAIRAQMGQLTEDDLHYIEKQVAVINDDLFMRSEKEARAGAKIIVWGEANAFAFKKDEQVLLQRGSEFAKNHKLILAMGCGVWNENAAKPLENKIVLIGQDGTFLWQSLKAIPVPGGESAISLRDDGVLQISETALGQIGGAICFDMDFPQHLKQARSADLLLVPSNDWDAINPWHSHMARLRAIEQGFNMVRAVSLGKSMAVDSQGRILGSMDHDLTPDRSLVTNMPTKGRTTLYAIIGDAFVLLCFLVAVALAITAFRHSSPELLIPE